MQTRCAWRANGTPPSTAPARKPQGYAGTERQIRGALMAVLRESRVRLRVPRLDMSWPDATRREKALASLIDDGLAVEVRPGEFALIGDH